MTDGHLDMASYFSCSAGGTKVVTDNAQNCSLLTFLHTSRSSDTAIDSYFIIDCNFVQDRHVSDLFYLAQIVLPGGRAPQLNPYTIDSALHIPDIRKYDSNSE